MCRRCGSVAVVFRDVSGRGTLYSFTVSERAFVPGFEDALPLCLGLVELIEQPGVRLLGNLIVDDPAALRVGMAMVVVFVETTDGFVLPQFTPLGLAPSGLEEEITHAR
jgi:uncharacterized OB-fold protein